MKVNKENVMEYINYESGAPAEKTLQSSLIMFLMVGIPTSLFGAYSNITRIVLLPWVIIFIIWATSLMVNKKYSKKQFILFLSAVSLLISFLFMIAAYKYALLAYDVTMFQIFIIVVLYVSTNVINIMNVLRLINKGYYKKKGKNENPLALIIAMSVLGLSMGRMLYNSNQETVITILVSLLLFMSFLFTTGTHNFLKYYLIKRYIHM